MSFGITASSAVLATPPSVAPEEAGAYALGSTVYTIPSDGRPVYYIDPTNGNNANSGSINSPKQSISSVISGFKGSGSASAPLTLVLRAGVYQDGGIQPGNGYYITVQSYPGEVVWIDGSLAFSGPWTYNGNGTWTAAYDAPVIPDIGVDILQGDPYAQYPDMIFVDGAQLTQIGDSSTPSSGQFSVNRGGNTVTIATNPGGKQVRYSNHDFLFFSGSQINLYGVGVRRYKCINGATNTGLYYGGASENTVLENCIFTEMGRFGVSLTKANCRVTHCTFTHHGQTAIGGNSCDYLIIENSYFDHMNEGRWQPQPQIAAIKLTRARGTIARHNIFRDAGGGNNLWYDVFCTEVVAYDNDIDGLSSGPNGYADTGILYEESDGGFYNGVQGTSLLVGNTIINCRKSLAVVAAGNVIVANNTIHARWELSINAQAILVLQDRDVHPPEIASFCPRWTADVQVLNNRILPMTSGWQLLAFDSQAYIPRQNAINAGYGTPSQGQQVGGLMLTRVEGNWFAPATGSTSSGTIMATIGRADGVRKNVDTPSTLATPDSTYGITTNIGTNYQSATGPTSPSDHQTATPIPAAVATLLQQATGSRYVGNPIPAPVIAN